MISNNLFKTKLPFPLNPLQWLSFILFLIITGCSSNPEDKVIDPTTLNEKPDLDKVSVYVLAGDYYEMQIGVRGDQLTGIYQNPLATNQDEACFFFFEGKIGTKNPVEVTCYNPTTTSAPFSGAFKILGEAMIAKLNNIPSSGCNAEFTDDIGHSLVLDKQEEWAEIRIIAQPAELFDDAGSSLVIGVPLVKGTAVGIREKRGSWLWVDVLNQERNQGWIEEHILYPLMD